MGRVALLASVVGLFAGAALADTPEARANAKYREGKALVAEGKLEAAEAAFTEAWGIFQHPLIIKKRAEVRERRLNFDGALADYRAYLDRLKRRDKKERRLVVERIGLLEALLVKPVKTTVVASRTGVSVSVDRAPPRKTPFELELVPGKHLIRVVDSRFEEVEITHVARAGRLGVARVEVTKRDQMVYLSTDRRTLKRVTLSIDGKPVSLTSEERAGRSVARRLGLGAHQLKCQRPEVPEVYVDFTVQPGGSAEAVCSFAKYDRSVAADPWGWVTVSLAAGALGAGTGLMISWAQDVNLAEERNQDLKSSKHIVGGVMLGVGAALAVGSYFVFTRQDVDPDDAPIESRLAPVPLLGPGGMVGLGATGRF